MSGGDFRQPPCASFSSDRRKACVVPNNHEARKGLMQADERCAFAMTQQEALYQKMPSVGRLSQLNWTAIQQIIEEFHVPAEACEKDILFWEKLCRESATIRVGVLDVFALAPEQAPVPVLLYALSDPSWEVRTAAAQVLGKAGHRSTVIGPCLYRALMYEMDENVLAALLRALGHSQGASSSRLFAAFLSDRNQNWLVREAAAWALGTQEHSEGLPDLIAALRRDEDESVRATAARSLGMLKRREAEMVLLEALWDEEEEVQEAAIWALQQLEGRKQLEERRWLQRFQKATLLRRFEMLIARTQKRFPYKEAREQYLRERDFALLVKFIHDKKGYIVLANTLASEWRRVFILHYCYEHAGQTLQEAVFPQLKKAIVEPMENMFTAPEGISKDILSVVTQIQGKRSWSETSLISVAIYPPGEEPLLVVLCGIGCQKVRQTDDFVLRQITRTWKQQLDRPLLCERPSELGSLHIWYQGTNEQMVGEQKK